MYFFFFEDNKIQGKEVSYSEATFEDIKHIDKDGNEFWYARELQVVLGYKR